MKIYLRQHKDDINMIELFTRDYLDRYEDLLAIIHVDCFDDDIRGFFNTVNRWDGELEGNLEVEAIIA